MALPRTYAIRCLARHAPILRVANTRWYANEPIVARKVENRGRSVLSSSDDPYFDKLHRRIGWNMKQGNGLLSGMPADVISSASTKPWRPYNYVWRLGLAASGFGLVVGGTAYLALQLCDTDGQQEISSTSGGARRQRHSYPISTAVGVISAALFTLKSLVGPSLMAKYSAINLELLSATGGRFSASVPILSTMLAHFSHRTLLGCLVSTAGFVWLARETEYLVSPYALCGVIAAGMASSTVFAAVLPLALGGGKIHYLHQVSGLSSLTCATLGFLSTFEDAGDIPRYLFYAVLGLSFCRAAIYSHRSGSTSRLRCVTSAFNLGGVCGGWAVGKIPDLILICRRLAGEAVNVNDAESVKAYRRRYWNMHLPSDPLKVDIFT